MFEKLPYSILLFTLVLILYSNALDGDFLYDDEFLIQKNNIVHNIDLLPHAFVTSSTEGSGGKDSFYRPLQIITYSFIYQFAGDDPFWFHLFNISIHALNAVLIFLLLSTLFNQWVVKREYALIIALLWAVHPIHTEAVSYISATADPLHFFFGLWFLLLGLKRSLKAQVFSIVFLIAALLTKESAVTFPALLFAIFLTSQRTFKKSLVDSTLPLLISVVYIVLRKTYLDFDDSFSFYSVENIYTSSFTNRLFTHFAALTKYMELLIWPAHLQIDRSFPIYTSFWSLRVIVGTLLTAISLLPLFKIKQISNHWLFFSLWFWGYHILHTGIPLPLNSLFLEHWMYVPSLGVIGVLVITLSRLKWKWTGFFFFIWAVALGLKTRTQNLVWQSPIALYEHILSGSPDIARVHNNLAMAYSDRNQYQKAEKHYLKSIEINDTYPQVRHNLGLLYLKQNQIDKGIFQLKKALEINPRFFHSHLYLYRAYEFKGDKKLAEEHLRRFKELSPPLFKPPESL